MSRLQKATFNAILNSTDGDYIFEKDHLSARQLRELKDLDGYLPSQIDKVLKEGPGKISESYHGRPDAKQNKHRFEVWYYYGILTREEMERCRPGSMRGVDRSEVYALVTLVNDSVIRATLNPLDSGSFPYHAVPWQRRPGHWVGGHWARQHDWAAGPGGLWAEG